VPAASASGGGWSSGWSGGVDGGVGVDRDRPLRHRTRLVRGVSVDHHHIPGSPRRVGAVEEVGEGVGGKEPLFLEPAAQVPHPVEIDPGGQPRVALLAFQTIDTIIGLGPLRFQPHPLFENCSTDAARRAITDAWRASTQPDNSRAAIRADSNASGPAATSASTFDRCPTRSTNSPISTPTTMTNRCQRVGEDDMLISWIVQRGS